MVIIRNWEFILDADHVLRAQGSDPDAIRVRKPQLYNIAEWAVNEGFPLLNPAVIQDTFEVMRLRHMNLELQTERKGLARLSGSLIAQHLATAEQVIVNLCTIGDALEQLAAELMMTDPLYGWAMDSFGSAAVEFLATKVCSRIENDVQNNGSECSIPLSPGMIGWEVKQGQQEIFNLIDASEIGVNLNSSYQMQPAKTISFVVGRGSSMSVSGKTCDYCAMNETCRYQNHYTG